MIQARNAIVFTSGDSKLLIAITLIPDIQITYYEELSVSYDNFAYEQWKNEQWIKNMDNGASRLNQAQIWVWTTNNLSVQEYGYLVSAIGVLHEGH